MARCDEGYRCVACGQDVSSLDESALYLRYLLGEVPLERLHLEPECHLRCLPAVAQYVADPDFDPVACPGPFDKAGLDPGYVAAEERRVTAAWRRLRELPRSGLPLPEYPAG